MLPQSCRPRAIQWHCVLVSGIVFIYGKIIHTVTGCPRLILLQTMFRFDADNTLVTKESEDSDWRCLRHGCGKSRPHRESITGKSSSLLVAIPTTLSRTSDDFTLVFAARFSAVSARPQPGKQLARCATITIAMCAQARVGCTLLLSDLNLHQNWSRYFSKIIQSKSKQDRQLCITQHWGAFANHCSRGKAVNIIYCSVWACEPARAHKCM